MLVACKIIRLIAESETKDWRPRKGCQSYCDFDFAKSSDCFLYLLYLLKTFFRVTKQKL